VIVVVNSSPLISLSGIGALDLLRAVFGNVIIAKAVYDEVVMAGTGRVGGAEVAAADWIQRRAVADTAAAKLIVNTSKLRPGESETLILAQELKAHWAVIDERPARYYAQSLGVPVIGTLGVLLLAKAQGDIVEVRPLLDQLAAFGMRLDKSLYQEVLYRAGE
jgi:hypothetical protein